MIRLVMLATLSVISGHPILAAAQAQHVAEMIIDPLIQTDGSQRLSFKPNLVGKVRCPEGLRTPQKYLWLGKTDGDDSYSIYALRALPTTTFGTDGSFFTYDMFAAPSSPKSDDSCFELKLTTNARSLLRDGRYGIPFKLKLNQLQNGTLTLPIYEEPSDRPISVKLDFQSKDQSKDKTGAKEGEPQMLTLGSPRTINVSVEGLIPSIKVDAISATIEVNNPNYWQGLNDGRRIPIQFGEGENNDLVTEKGLPIEGQTQLKPAVFHPLYDSFLGLLDISPPEKLTVHITYQSPLGEKKEFRDSVGIGFRIPWPIVFFCAAIGSALGIGLKSSPIFAPDVRATLTKSYVIWTIVLALVAELFGYIFTRGGELFEVYGLKVDPQAPAQALILGIVVGLLGFGALSGALKSIGVKLPGLESGAY